MEVAQFIYLRLEKSESPRRVGGFQTASFTRPLISETVMEEIESHLRCDAAKDEPQLIFRPVGEQQVVLAQLQTISKVDNCGRRGNFVAHGLVLDRRQFLSVGGNPITLANSTRFITSEEDAKCQGDMITGDMKPYEFLPDSIASPSEIVERAQWVGSELRNLLVLSTCLASASAKSRPVAICGSTGQIRATLQFVFELLPLSLRPCLAFHTHSPRLDRGDACLQGFCTRPVHHGCAEIDANDCTADSAEEPATSFARWIRQTRLAHTAADFARMHECCWSLGRLIDCVETDGGYLPLGGPLTDEFWQLNGDAASRRLLTVYSRRVGRALAQRALRVMLLRYSPRELFEQIAAGGQDTAVARSLHLAYCKAAQPAPREERKLLADFLSRYDDKRLTVWLAIWSRDWPLLRRCLRRLQDEELSQLVADTADVDDVDISRFLISGRQSAVAIGLLRDVDLVDGPHAASGLFVVPGQAGPASLKPLSVARLAKLDRLISLEPELFSRKARQAIADQCQRQGVMRSRRMMSFGWWRSQ